MGFAESFCKNNNVLDTSVSLVQSQADTYFGGFVARFVAARFKCKDCLLCISSDEVHPNHLYTQFKEYDEIDRLTYVSSEFAKYCGTVMRFVFKNVETVAHHQDIDAELKAEVLKSVRSDFTGCAQHEGEFVDEVIDFLILMSLRWFSKELNVKLKEEAEKAAQKSAKFIKVVSRSRSLLKKSLTIVRRKASKKK